MPSTYSGYTTKDKEERILKVYNQSRGDKWNIPTIILKGEWLEKLGFECGDQIEVSCNEGVLTIKSKTKY